MLEHASPYMEHLGPESAEELGQWDDFVCSKLVNLGTAERALDTMKAGVVMYSDYSGMDFPREAARIAIPGLARHVGRDVPVVEHVRSCDWGDVQKRVLRAQSQQLSPNSCVFENIAQRLPKCVRHREITSILRRAGCVACVSTNASLLGDTHRAMVLQVCIWE